MWILGTLLGAVLGAIVGRGNEFMFGAALGGLAGWAIGQGWTRRIGALETRLAALEKELALRAEPAPPPAAVTAPEEIPEAPTPAIVEPVHQPAPIATPPAAVPAGPTALERFFARFLGGNVVVKIGIVVLFFGIAFLLKYTYERIHVPIELRLTGAALGAAALLAIGWWLRERRPGYALVLQGGGVAILYLVVFVAFRLFHLLPAPLTFALLVGIAVFSAVLAVAQDSLSLAVVGASGGFVAPILASTGQGSHVMLFSYYAVLNAGIVGVAWLRAWRVLNLDGFGFTFGIGTLWGLRAYRPELFDSTEPFLLLFFAMYIAIPILFARRRAVELKDYVDGTLVFGVPIAAFGLQAALVRPFEYGGAWSALGLGLFYMVLALAMFRRTGANFRLLVESFVALSLAFGTLAIPLAFDGRMTSAAWALEGAAVVWMAMRQGRLLARVFGYALQAAAGVAFLKDAARGYDATPVLNSFYVGSVFLAVAAFFCAAYIERNRANPAARLREEEGHVGTILLGWGALWWFGGGAREIDHYVGAGHRTHALLLFFAFSSAAFSVVSRAVRWTSGEWLRFALYPAIALTLGRELLHGPHPFAGIGALAWGAALCVHFWMLARRAAPSDDLNAFLHAAGVWTIAIVGAREIGWLIDTAVEGKRVWPAIAWAIWPAALLAALSSTRLQARWPLAASVRSYLVLGGAPIAVFLAAWLVVTNWTSDGDPYPLVYIPLLNPLDLAIAGIFVVLARWLRAGADHGGLGDWLDRSRPMVFSLFGAAGFLWINGMLLRGLHHWADVPFALRPMLGSQLVQAAFSILWMALALAAMVFATRRGLRPLWIAGAALMGVVVAKLFLVDLSQVGTVERIVSFIVAGALMLLVGYFSPVPPRREALPS